MQLRIALLLVRRILTLYSTVLSLPLPHATPHCPASRPQNSHTLQHCAQPPSAPCNSALPCFSSAEFSHSTALCSASLCAATISSFRAFAPLAASEAFPALASWQAASAF